ncbi:MAG: DUF1249 domain-containing protein [Candidatus Omnitrophica bacterium]|nr:DUF1249 domain-containing protein [Candidatus Omnitrophota bacterium]
MVVYETIFKRLVKIGIIDSEGRVQFGEALKLKSDGFMDLNLDMLYEEDGKYTIAMAHNYIQNGDVMADPDMEIRIIPSMKMAEALSFRQDGGIPINQHVYEEVDGKTMVYPRIKKELNTFLSGWLLNIKNQGFKHHI